MSCREHDREQVIHQAVFHPDLFSLALKIHDVLRGDHWLNILCRMKRRRAIQDLLFLLGRRIPDAKSHEESVELGFWKRKGAVILRGVLCGNDHERLA